MRGPLKFFRQIWDELKLVVWPTRKEVFRLTTIVVILSVILGLYIGGLDYVFTTAVEQLLR
jgi:preprotein translocase subunit SecE